MKNCPFCKATEKDLSFSAQPSQADYRQLCHVYCTKCHAFGPMRYSLNEAEEAWDKRASECAGVPPVSFVETMDKSEIQDIRNLRQQRDDLKKELETLKCLQESDHHRAEKWAKIADELRKESEHRKDVAIQLENIIGVAYKASKDVLDKN